MALRLVFVGAPGVGKGTYATRVCREYGLTHLATGDLFRAEIKSGSALGNELQDCISQGSLASDEQVCQMILPHIQRHSTTGFVLDGFPRTIAQANFLGENIPLTAVVQLNQSYNIIRKKLSGRRVCADCGTSFNLETVMEEGVHMPAMLPKVEGVCDACGGELEQRKDDNPEVVEKRLKLYDLEAAPILAHYHSLNKLVRFDVAGATKVMYPKFKDLVQQIMSISQSGDFHAHHLQGEVKTD